VLHAGLDTVALEVSGVGFSVAVPPDVARTARAGHELFLHTHLIVREDAMSLVGFATADELDVFGTLLGVGGVGPKSALGILATLTIDQIAEAVEAEDDRPFRKVSGIGPKGRLAAPTREAAVPAAPDVSDQVVQALVGLGWAERVAIEAVDKVSESASDADRASVGSLLRLTLAALGPAKSGGARG
jgi:Holliday junction DNA helicase RuvA